MKLFQLGFLYDTINFTDKFDKNDEPIAIGTSFLSDISSAISSDYQASIETSSEKSDIHFPEVR